MNTPVNTDDVIFNFFKQVCDEKDDQKCVELGKEWIKAMQTNLSEMEKNLNGADYIKHKDDICLLYTSPSPRDPKTSRMPSSA